MMHVKKNDTVQVIAGKEKGKTGKVLGFHPSKGRVRVEGVMMIKRHLKRGRTPSSPEGGIIEEPGTIHHSNLMLICPRCSKPTRAGHAEVGGKKVRACKKCKQPID